MTAQTYQDGKLFVSPTTQSSTVDQAAFLALADWVEIENIVTMPSFQVTDNILTENYLNSDIAEKQKGFRQAEDTELVIGFDEDNAGHGSLIGLAETKLVYPVRLELANTPNGGTNGTRFFALALIGGGGINGGGGEDFVRRTFQFALTRQRPIEVAAA